MIVYLNGEFVEHDRARVSVFDRGFVFGDGLYEGLRAFSHQGRRRMIAPHAHVARMRAGLEDVGITFDPHSLIEVSERVLDANRLDNAFVYWQVSRGTPDLSRGPARSRIDATVTTPTVFVYASPLAPIDFERPVPAARRAWLMPDPRWSMGHVKAISLIGNIAAAMSGVRAGAAFSSGAAGEVQETLLYRNSEMGERVLTEGTYSNVLLGLRKVGGGQSSDPLDRFEFVTPSLGSAPILNGVTRWLLLKLCPTLQERKVMVNELHHAAEVLLTGTTTMVASVTHIDGEPVGSGQPGPVAQALNAHLVQAIRDGADMELPVDADDFRPPAFGESV